jgi:hypothetical protein
VKSQPWPVLAGALLKKASMKPLQLPPTIKMPTPAEPANLVEGYTLSPDDDDLLPNTFLAQININNENLWALCRILILQLPEEVCMVFGPGKEDYSLGDAMDKMHLLNELEPFHIELSQDPGLQFSIFYQDEEYYEHVLVTQEKYIHYWGMNEVRFRNTMK